jgi:hypothetical protein
MKGTSANSEKESTEALWRRVLRITNRDEFQQCLAVAQLAVKLCELKRAELNTGLQKESIVPEKFLKEAWKLIESAREHVLRPQGYAEYLAEHGGSDEAMEEVVGDILRESYVPFQKLVDPGRKNGDSEKICLKTFSSKGKEETICVQWRVYTTEKAFDNLFWAYWRDTSILKLRTIVSTSEVLGNEPDKWERYGKQMLASWKRDGIPPNDFLALAKFRREHDKRAANLKPKQKRNNRRTTVKSRVGARKHRTR